MPMIGLIAAMDQEGDALLHLIQGAKRTRVGEFRAHRFEVAGLDCLLVTCGMGMRRAGKAARMLAAADPLKAVISFGIAGAVERELAIGEVIAADTVCMLEEERLGAKIPLTPWPEPAWEVITRAVAVHEARLTRGSAVTTRGSQLAEGQVGQLMHPILEMETAGIAQALAGTGIPLYSLRAISDGPSAPIPVDLSEMMDEEANLRVGKLLGALIRHPGLLLQARRMMDNTNLATKNAAIAVVAGLEWLAKWGGPDQSSEG